MLLISKNVLRLAKVEMLLVLRHHRSRLVFLASVIGSFFVVILLYPQTITNNKVQNLFTIFSFLILPLAFISGYSHYGFGWLGKTIFTYFTNNIKIREIMLSRMLFLSLLNLSVSVAPLLFIYFLCSQELFALMLSGLFYGNAFIVIYNIVFWKRISVQININEKGYLANWEGQSYKQWGFSIIWLLPLFMILILFWKINFSINVISLSVFFLGCGLLIGAILYINSIKDGREVRYELFHKFQK